MPKSKSLTNSSDEVCELGNDFFQKAKRGRPTLPDDAKKVRVQLTLDPEVAAALRSAKGNASQRVNNLLREDLGLKK
ncbi:BrnA antitoxin family protein [Sulfitobacter sp. 20_GPM-1509m]|uniref:BrnA antitoxin family protein n=1 Tax=Sulfitobacter sp. 20_GPM-1509m TaxID=1380367 RepID=UPI00048CBD34|nr:BrnA antitoxin family protein [Sulfitobacter sp. 20_GPM-1509m]